MTLNKKDISIIVVEDDFVASQTVSGYLRKFGCSSVHCAMNAGDALRIMQAHRIQMAIIDIGLGKNSMDGVELARVINKRFPRCAVVFLTSYFDGITLERVANVRYEAYFVKPVGEREFYVNLELIFRKISQEYIFPRENIIIRENVRDAIFLKGASKFYHRISISDILYIKADKDAKGIDFFLVDGRSYFSYAKLASVVEKVQHPDLLRVHRSYVVNLRHVSSKSDRALIMSDGRNIKIGPTYRDVVDRCFWVLRSK